MVTRSRVLATITLLVVVSLVVGCGAVWVIYHQPAPLWAKSVGFGNELCEISPETVLVDSDKKIDLSNWEVVGMSVFGRVAIREPHNVIIRQLGEESDLPLDPQTQLCCGGQYVIRKGEDEAGKAWLTFVKVDQQSATLQLQYLRHLPTPPAPTPLPTLTIRPK